MIKGINQINIAVSHIERSFLFYKDILGFKPLCKSEGSAYFLAGNPNDPLCFWFSLDLDSRKVHQRHMGALYGVLCCLNYKLL